MFYKDFVKEVSHKVDLPQATTREVLDSATKLILSGVAKGTVRLTSFGSFRVVTRKPRTKKLPNGKVVNVPAKKKLVFKPSKNVQV